MAQSKVNQNELRRTLLNSGTLRETGSALAPARTSSKAESQAAAIASRRSEMNLRALVTKTLPKQGA